MRLPDGSTVTAPNAEAAGAVRSALTQQGVPYAWGGTTPGTGLDCSGLTQWAYAQQGVDIPGWRRNRTSARRSRPVTYSPAISRCGTAT